MELNKLAPYRACEIFKEVLSDTYTDSEGTEYTFFHEFGVKSKDDIFIGAVKPESIPDVFAVIYPNGSTKDIGDLANQTILLELSIALSNGMPNTKRNIQVINKLNEILSEPKGRDGCWFSLNKYGAVAENINITTGFSTTLININIKIL